MHRGSWLIASVGMLLMAAVGCSDSSDRGDGSIGSGDDAVATAPSTGCVWETAGGGLDRLAVGCDSDISPETAGRMVEDWFLDTPGEVTAAPLVTEDRVVVGDWTGRVTAARRDSGAVVWTRDLPTSPLMYAGQINATPSLAELEGEQVVLLSAARTVHALSLDSGVSRWAHVLGDPDDPADNTEAMASLAVADDLVVVPLNTHNESRRAGVLALSLADGTERWRYDPEAGVEAGGCGGVWSAPAIDLERRLVVVGTANCPTAASWTAASEAIVGIDLDTGEQRWTFQPHEKDNLRDWDFAGAPNLFEIGGRAVVGLGNKDGWYYVVDRERGELVWKAEAQRQPDEGRNFAFGGFIGATTVAPSEGRAVVAGITAIGDCPCVHAFDAATGEIVWQSPKSSGSYGGVAASGGLVFGAGLDRTLRAWDLIDGTVRWQAELRAISASSPAVVGNEVFIGVGFREPGSKDASGGGGVHRFRLADAGDTARTSVATTTTTIDDASVVRAIEPLEDPCVGTECELGFQLKAPPVGVAPSAWLEITPQPLRIAVRADGLGPPGGWLRAGSDAAVAGASAYGLVISTRDDQPESGTIVCTFTETETGCEADRVASTNDRFTRITLVALEADDRMPGLADGFDRLVTTRSFDPPLIPVRST